MEPDPMYELQQSTSPAAPKLTWGEIMDAEDNALENVAPFCFYNPWSRDTINQVEEQKVETKNVEKRVEEQRVEEQKVEMKNVEKRVEEKRVEEQKVEEQAKVMQMPVKHKKLPKERLSKNTKINMENGRPKGTGFVTFASADEARNAIIKMNGRVLGSRPLYISPVQSKEVHGARHRERMERSPKEPCPNPHQAQKNIQLQRRSVAQAIR
ncbi:polyadenylate-binding protein 1-like isoform X1 [Tachysurus ichikawai]